MKDATVRTTRIHECCTTAAATNGTEDASIEEVITDALPEDLDEIVEWVFREIRGRGRVRGRQ